MFDIIDARYNHEVSEQNLSTLCSRARQFPRRGILVPAIIFISKFATSLIIFCYYSVVTAKRVFISVVQSASVSCLIEF